MGFNIEAIKTLCVDEIKKFADKAEEIIESEETIEEATDGSGDSDKKYYEDILARSFRNTDFVVSSVRWLNYSGFGSKTTFSCYLDLDDRYELFIYIVPDDDYISVDCDEFGIEKDYKLSEIQNKMGDFADILSDEISIDRKER